MFSFLKPGTVVLALLSVLPLLIAALFVKIAEIQTTAGILNLLGRAAGILGASLFLLAVAQAVRIPGFDRWFGGLTRLWKVHHVFGAAAFLLVMLHPLLLAFAAAPVSLQAAAAILLPELTAWSLWAGWLALLLMMVFLAPTFSFFGSPEYQRWKVVHKVSGLALILALAHVLPLNRSGRWGAIIWLALAACAVLAFLYRVFLAPRIGRRLHTVAEVKPLARGVVELTLEPDNRLLRYQPGQFVYLTPLDPKLASGRSEEHPYTLSSAPQEPVLRIVIRDVGDATRALQNVFVGSQALIEGPYGEFFPPGRKEKRELWLAGGVGLAPFLSRARSLAAIGSPVDICLIYCAQDESRAYFLSELADLASKLPGFRVYPHYFYREGRLTAAFISARCPDFTGREVYVCGPPAMIGSVRSELAGQRIARSRIHSEDFTWL